MISKAEKIWLHKYARWAGLRRPEYVEILRSSSGKSSAADPRFTHEDVDRAMAAFETVLWERIDARLVPEPRGIARFHWRNRLPRDGMINSRLRWKVNRYWKLLRDYLPGEERNEAYLAALIAKAAGAAHGVYAQGGRIAWEKIPAEAARLAIEAIKDRLSHAVRTAA